MSDLKAFGEAQAETDAAKAAALAALARGGSSALAEHQAAIAQDVALKQAATEGALRRAAGINAEAAGDAIAKGGSLVGRPEAIPGMSTNAIFDRYSQDRQRAGAARQQAMADLAAGNANYFAQVNASRPAAEAHALAALAKQRQSDDLSDSELRTRLLGAARANEAASPLKDLSVFGVKLPQLSETTRARNVGVDAGIDPARVYGVLAPPEGRQPKQVRPTQVLADQKAQAELDARAARLKLLDTARRAASTGTYAELEKAIDVGEEQQDLQAAVDYVDSLDDGYLKRNRISRSALLDWVTRYGGL